MPLPTIQAIIRPAHWGVAAQHHAEATVNTLGIHSHGAGTTLNLFLQPSIQALRFLVQRFGKTFDNFAPSIRPGVQGCHLVNAGPVGHFVEALLISTGVVALAEIGDKTQLLAFLLATRFKKPVPIVLGILAATLINHGLAGVVGAWITGQLGPELLRWILGVSFLAMAVWTLIPDKIEDEETDLSLKMGVFGATFITFFLAEMGDKTQIATVAMAARFEDVVMVVAGTTLGMLIADVPAVFAGEKLAHKIPMKLVHGIAAAMFALMGLATLLGFGQSLF